MKYITEILTSAHDKSLFTCGKESLDNYIKKRAKQDMKRRLSVVFVYCDIQTQRIKGYYSLSNESIPREIAPQAVLKKMPPSYIHLPVTLLGRLAVDMNDQGQKLGERLLLDALKRSYDISKESIGSIAVLVDPLDSNAVSFYESYGFILIPDRGRMFLPMQTIASLFKR